MRQWQPPGIHVCASWRSGRLRRVPRCGQDPEQCAGAWRTLDLWLASRGTALLPLRARTKAESRRWRESVQKGLFREGRRIDERIRFLSCSRCYCSAKDLIPETNEPKRAAAGRIGCSLALLKMGGCHTDRGGFSKGEFVPQPKMPGWA